MEKYIKSAQEAKELSMEIWLPISEQGLVDKEQLPSETYNKIKNLFSKCPLCEWFKFDTGQTYINGFGHVKHVYGVDCNKCPLGMAGHKCENDDPVDICTKCSEDQFICKDCFSSKDYFTQWNYAYVVYLDDEAKKASMKASRGVYEIIRDWEI
jgi:hypothetical protein